MKKQKKVQFHAVRIQSGNPIKGTVVSEDKESITVLLHHDIEGLNTIWEAGEEKCFKKDLIAGKII